MSARNFVQRMITPWGLLPLVALLAAAGCQAPAQPEGPAIAYVRAAGPVDRDLLYDAAGDTLRKYHFELDRQDRMAGVITTLPDTSASWFEFWRTQPSTAYYWWESNFQTIHRLATVKLHQTEQDDLLELDVQVDRYRYALEERQIDNSAAAMRLFGSAAPTASGQMERAEDSGYRILLGRDAEFERLLINAIVARFETLEPPVSEELPTP
ncbi:MAG: hypothetical protein GXY44_11150 [Phycisphaerales bacterium]|nr:hypothetical protein [Phycisphaerales bacterium]